MIGLWKQILKVPRVERRWVKDMMAAIQKDKKLKENIFYTDSRYDYKFCRDRIMENDKVQQSIGSGGRFFYTYDIVRHCLLNGVKVKVGNKNHKDTYSFKKFSRECDGKTIN